MEAKDILTLAAAVIAAIASLLVLLGNARVQRSTELRVAHRKFLEPHITELGEALHEIVATSAILSKSRTDASRDRWKARSYTAKAKLNKLRPQLRYPLWGLDQGFRVLIRVPDWALHVRDDPQRTAELIKTATRLRAHLDYAIQGSYRNGRPPLLFEAMMVQWRARQCRRIFETQPVMRNDEEAATIAMLGRDAVLGGTVDLDQKREHAARGDRKKPDSRVSASKTRAPD